MNEYFTKNTETSPQRELELDKETQMHLLKAIKWAKNLSYINIFVIIVVILSSIIFSDFSLSLALFVVIYFGWPVFFIFKYAKRAKKAMIISQIENENGYDYTAHLKKSLKSLFILTLFALLIIVVLIIPMLCFMI
ncbi:MAG: hypothetical protein LBE13_05530 [Bacteroidales bacterium]|jgi:Ca2+/Na+ antiporter|nr:hypothetical protein [Bacteroidales bacterium]